MTVQKSISQCWARPSQNGGSPQSLEEHLQGVARRAEQFAKSFNSERLAKIAGLLHDIGKADPKFQKYLARIIEDPERNEHCEINHSDAGAVWMEKLGKEANKNPLFPFICRTLAYIVAGHHAGLPNAHNDGKAALTSRIQQGEVNYLAVVEQTNCLYSQLELENSFQSFKSFNLAPDNYHFWVRFLFSCLVDADRLDAEFFTDKEQSAKRSQFLDIVKIKERFDQYMQRFDNITVEELTEDVRRLQQARADVLNACRKAGQGDASGVFSLTVPTGGGKTFASMAFALERAVRAGRERVIYVAPYTTILEQTGDRFAEIFGRENVVEHHCNFESDKYLQEGGGKYKAAYEEKMKLAAENWDAPIIITTNVQFFESLFAANPNRCRKLHNIANSVVILDEAQALPTDLLSPCVSAINELTEKGTFNVDLVVCTATQPTLDRIDRIPTPGKKYKPLRSPIPIISKELETRLFNDLARVEYKFEPTDVKREWEDLARELAKPENAEVLCIVNTRKDCCDLYNALCREVEKNTKTDENERQARTICLSALMCGEHRAKLLREIRQRLEDNRQRNHKTPLRVIATQLVEAGVDVDFPVVYRALTGLDSIAQAAGRCNREGRLGKHGGRVVVFTPPNNSPKGSLRKGEDATRSLLNSDLSINMNNPQIFEQYFEYFFAELQTLDSERFIEALTKNVVNSDGKPSVPFRTVGEKFKLIDDEEYRTVVIQYGDNNNLLNQLEMRGPDSQTMRKLQRFVVNIPKKIVESLIGDGVVKEIYPGVYIQKIPGYYQEEIGFNLFRNTLPDEASII